MKWSRLFLVSLLLIPVSLYCHPPASEGALYLVIDKSDYTITLYDSYDWLIRWPCTFGNSDLGDKMYQGDRRTPEGLFRIAAKYPHNKWHRFLRINYPTPADYEKFNKRKKEGIIPSDAKIGGDIGIHGTWPNEDWAIDRMDNWTLGCISMKNEHIDELYKKVPVGTRVVILK